MTKARIDQLDTHTYPSGVRVAHAPPGLIESGRRVMAVNSGEFCRGVAEAEPDTLDKLIEDVERGIRRAKDHEAELDRRYLADAWIELVFTIAFTIAAIGACVLGVYLGLYS